MSGRSLGLRGRGLRKFGTRPPSTQREGAERSPEEPSAEPLGTRERDLGELRGGAGRAWGRSLVQLEGGARENAVIGLPRALGRSLGGRGAALEKAGTQFLRR